MSSTTRMASSLAVLISLIACAALASGAAGVRVDLKRVHSSRLVGDALGRDMHRHGGRRLAASGDTASASVRKDPAMGEYLMTLAIGTPPLSYPAIADTGSDLIWTQCAPCSDQCFEQPTPLYNPASSTTFSLQVNKTYNYTYGLGWTAGVLGLETFTFGSTPADQTRVPGITFGCSNATSNNFNGSSGLVGLGRGSASLVSQLGAGRFSYCLTTFQDTSSTSTLLLGPSASLNDTGVGSTPFVTSPAQALTHFYLNLTGISLGKKKLSISPNAFALKANGTGGIIIDSGTTLTYLVDAAYQQVRAAVLSMVKLPTTDVTGLDLCFELPSSTSAPPAMPSMTLHFDGADMVIAGDNYMILESGLWCLVMQPMISGLPSILGNYQQQNMHILYDVAKETLSFAPANCSAF